MLRLWLGRWLLSKYSIQRWVQPTETCHTALFIKLLRAPLFLTSRSLLNKRMPHYPTIFSVWSYNLDEKGIQQLLLSVYNSPSLCMYRVKLEDNKTIVDANLCNNSSVLLIVMSPFELYIQDMNGRQHTVIVPSSEPEVCMSILYAYIYSVTPIIAIYTTIFCSNTPSPHLLLLLKLRLGAVWMSIPSHFKDGRWTLWDMGSNWHWRTAPSRPRAASSWSKWDLCSTSPIQRFAQ